MKIAGVVVLYNPPEDIVDNISSYASQVEILFVLDNSALSQEHLLADLVTTAEIRYQWMKGNQGLAFPINEAARLARDHGMDWLLTMDQDSQTPVGFVAGYFRQIENQTVPQEKIAAAGCGYGNEGLSTRSPIFNITSGSIVNLAVFQQLGGYNEAFFIDHLDHEYNLKALAQGYEILSFPDLQLLHQLGTDQKVSLGGQTISYKSHSAKRVFYFVRNGANLLKRFGLTFPLYTWYYLKYMIKTILKLGFGEKQEGFTLTMIIKAFLSGIKGDLGK